MATPLVAATEVVPAAKLPEESATWMVSVEPVLPVVIVLPYWSSTVTPTEKVVPAAKEEGGWVVMASLFSGPGETVIEFVAAAVTPVRDVSLAVIVNVPAFVISSPLNVATPLVAATEVVPEAKLPEESARRGWCRSSRCSPS